MKLGRYRIHLEAGHLPRPRRAGAAVVAGVALVALVALALPASADGGATGTVDLAPNASLRAILVSPTTFQYSLCQAGIYTVPTLEFAGGNCRTSGYPLTVTNDGVGGHIEVATTDFVPSDNGANHWVVCARTPQVTTNTLAPTCTGPSANPGDDQAALGVFSSTGGQDIGPQATCDLAWSSGGSCLAVSGQSATEAAVVYAPHSSTDLSTTFSNVITWYAVP
jgi:hypothetical protein